MNKLLLLIALPLLVYAVEWRTWEQGIAEAETLHKNILVAFVREGCHYCHNMERDVFNDTNMSRWIELCFVPVKVNLSERKAPIKARIPMTPTFVLLQPDGKTIKTIPGSWDIPDFAALTSAACTKD